MTTLERRIAALERARDRLPFEERGGEEPRLILIYGGLPTESDEPEAKIGDGILVSEPGEDLALFYFMRCLPGWPGREPLRSIVGLSENFWPVSDSSWAR